MGRFSAFSKDFTPTHYNAVTAKMALDRLATRDEPFALTVSFHSPHCPFVAAAEYAEHYLKHTEDLFVSPSITDTMRDSAYGNQRTKRMGYDDPAKVREWTAIYYALVEEIDHHVGTLLDELERHGIENNTLVVFTSSDHGEMLGAHAMREKNNFYEESVRVPLFLSFPKEIAPNTTVEESVSHLDLYATILDYLGLSASDNSDGTSLRRFVERESFNEHHDETVVVSEWDFRYPITQTTSASSSPLLARPLGSETNFMVRKGPHKLMMTKLAGSSRPDMLYDLERDPHETNNFVARRKYGVTDDLTIGKAEHLKCRLLEWMERMDGDTGRYSSNDPALTDSAIGPFTNSVRASRGDVEEIRARRTWRPIDFWVSDETLVFGSPVRTNGEVYVRNEYLYFGRTRTGPVEGDGWNTTRCCSLTGSDASYFSLEVTTSSSREMISSGDCVRLKVTYSSPVNVARERGDGDVDVDGTLNASIVLSHGDNATVVPIAMRLPTSVYEKREEDNDNVPSSPPTRSPTHLPSVAPTKSPRHNIF